MTLYDYLLNTDGDEVSVYDTEYDIEVYFYRNDEPSDDWDKATNELAQLLEIVKQEGDNQVTVNLSGLIESKMDKIGVLFKSADIDDIMNDIEAIISGYVSEKWFRKFVNGLK